MSADLLRRAAVKLRESAAVADMNGYMAAPWRTVLTDSESLTGVAGCGGQAADEHVENSTCDDCTSIEAWMEPAAAYIALMHPPVALALAELLELEAVVIGKSEAIGMRLSYSAEKSVALARVILREEES